MICRRLSSVSLIWIAVLGDEEGIAVDGTRVVTGGVDVALPPTALLINDSHGLELHLYIHKFILYTIRVLKSFIHGQACAIQAGEVACCQAHTMTPA